MIIDRITITGADSNTNPDDLLKIQEQYPQAEWGILISGSKVNVDRYPTYEWIENLPLSLNLSLHICGAYVRNICKGKWDLPINPNKFKRIQLNFSTYLNTIDTKDFIDGLKYYPKEYIWQIKTPTPFLASLRNVAIANNISASFLYDKSGGKGIYDKDWPSPIDYCGYAGGLNPETLHTELKDIEQVVQNNTVWIDVESNVRTNEVLDLDKVKLFLEKASSFKETK